MNILKIILILCFVFLFSKSDSETSLKLDKLVCESFRIKGWSFKKNIITNPVDIYLQFNKNGEVDTLRFKPETQENLFETMYFETDLHNIIIYAHKKNTPEALIDNIPMFYIERDTLKIWDLTDGLGWSDSDYAKNKRNNCKCSNFINSKKLENFLPELIYKTKEKIIKKNKI